MTLASCLRVAAGVVLAVGWLTGCRRGQPLLPDSGGGAYEVLVTGTEQALLDEVAGWLTETADADMPGAPEELFRVSVAKGTLTNATRYARNLLLVTRDESLVRTRVRFQRNAYAAPQLLVRIETPSAEQLHTDAVQGRRQLARLLTTAEQQTAMQALEQQHNEEATRLVAQQFGCRLLVPDGLAPVKQGRDFLWLSDNGAATMRNLCVYAVDGMLLSPGDVADRRDSVMRRNLPGEQPGMCMQTERRASLRWTPAEGPARRPAMVSGLWQMEGDDMGGPFTCALLTDSVQGRTVVAEAFLYAPGQKKRVAMKRLEAALEGLRFEE